MFEKFKLARDVATKSTWNDLPIWSPYHRLNRLGFLGSGMMADKEQIENDFEGYVNGVYKANGPVFACITARMHVFSEARFKFRNLSDDKLSEERAGLELLEHPWPGGTTGELLAKMEQDVSLAGNSWWTKTDDKGRFGKAARGPGLRLAHMRPDWVTMVIGSKSKDPFALDAHLVGIIYSPRVVGQTGPKAPDVLLTMEEVAHYSPEPDPIARFRGMSWITPILPEIESDKGATETKKNFYGHAAVPNMAVKFDKDTNEDDFDEFVDKFKAGHEGAYNAYKTLFLMPGSDVVPLTHDFKSMDFAQIIGKGESRIASAAGVPPSWVGFSEGLQGSALNSGSNIANRRRFADGTIRPLWRIVCASLAVLVDVPEGHELWWDEKGIAFLREDQRELAEIVRIDMNAIDSGIKAGFDSDAVVEAIDTKDLSKLIGKHTGLVSVQMMSPRAMEAEDERANVTLVLAQAAKALGDAGFSPESIAKALEETGAINLGALKEAELPPAPAPMNGQANGQAKPPQPKPGASNPGGGGNGQQAARTR